MNRTQYRKLSLFAVLAGLLVFTDGVAGETVQAPQHQVKGRGEWQSSRGGEFISGTWPMSLRRSERALSGTMQLTGSNVFKSGSVSGTIEGEDVVLGVGSDGVTEATFAGRWVGDSVSGEWQCPALKDEGVWSGTLSGK